MQGISGKTSFPIKHESESGDYSNNTSGAVSKTVNIGRPSNFTKKIKLFSATESEFTHKNKSLFQSSPYLFYSDLSFRSLNHDICRVKIIPVDIKSLIGYESAKPKPAENVLSGRCDLNNEIMPPSNFISCSNVRQTPYISTQKPTHSTDDREEYKQDLFLVNSNLEVKVRKEINHGQCIGMISGVLLKIFDLGSRVIHSNKDLKSEMINRGEFQSMRDKTCFIDTLAEGRYTRKMFRDNGGFDSSHIFTIRFYRESFTPSEIAKQIIGYKNPAKCTYELLPAKGLHPLHLIKEHDKSKSSGSENGNLEIRVHYIDDQKNIALFIYAKRKIRKHELLLYEDPFAFEEKKPMRVFKGSYSCIINTDETNDLSKHRNYFYDRLSRIKEFNNDIPDEHAKERIDIDKGVKIHKIV